MKEFFKMFLASLLALMFAGAGFLLLMFVLLGALASLSKPEPVVKNDSILLFDLSVNIQDSPVGMTGQEVINEALGKVGGRHMSLRSVTQAIEAAKEDSRIKGLLLTGTFAPAGYGTGFAALKDVRRAIKDFSASGKPVWAHVVYPTSRDLYLVTAADKVYMNPEGLIADLGMSMSAPYLAGFFEKYGVGVQITRAGEFKAAAESFVLDGMSEQAREANQALLADIWDDYLNTITEGSNVSAQEYETLLNTEAILMAPKAKEVGLVDELAFKNTMIDEILELVPADEEGQSFRQTNLAEYIRASVHPEYSKDGYVAVVYAEGSIVAGEGEINQVGGDRIARVIRQARMDEKVKAIVLRVNSPGGSALASEVIQNELRVAQEKMPVVVSMGAVAASGGYWISAYGDRIFAQPNTITGSIGVIGIFFNFEELARTHGVNFDSVKTTRHADLMSLARPKSEVEMALVQKQVDSIYQSFLSKVAEGRDLTVQAVKEIAEGRIWSGADAVDLGLVDELGGLDDAIAYAGQQVGLGESPKIKELPEPVNFLEELFGGLKVDQASAQAKLLAPMARIYEDLAKASSRYNDPAGVYSVLPYSLIID